VDGQAGYYIATRKERLVLIANVLFTLSVITNLGVDENLHETARGYEGGKPFPLYVSPIHQKGADGAPLFLSAAAADKFRDMTAAAARDGFYLKVTSAYRTYRHQLRLKRKKGNFAARPGWSTHQQGSSIDICGTTRTINGKKRRTILYWWMVRNGKKFGFYNDVDGELWHWTYVDGPAPKKRKRSKTSAAKQRDYI